MFKLRVAAKKHEDRDYTRYPVQSIVDKGDHFRVAFGPLDGDAVGSGCVPADRFYSIIFEFSIGRYDKYGVAIHWGDILHRPCAYMVNQHFVVVGDDTTLTYDICEYDMNSQRIGCPCGGIDLALCEVKGKVNY